MTRDLVLDPFNFYCFFIVGKKNFDKVDLILRMRNVPYRPELEAGLPPRGRRYKGRQGFEQSVARP